MMWMIVNAVLRSKHGATAVEYGLIIALIALAAVTAMGGTGNTTANMWNKVSGIVVNANNR
jgi:pilus assembly protein Flp/PilA